MQVEQHLVLVRIGKPLRNDDANRYPCDLVFGEGCRVKLEPGIARGDGPFVCAFATLRQRLGRPGIGRGF